MEDAKEVKLPTGAVAVIRTYTTRSDDRQASAILNAGMSASMDENGKSKMSFGLEAIEASQAKYVELLTISVNGETSNIPALLDGLRTMDYNALDKAVAEVTKVDPKQSKKS